MKEPGTAYEKYFKINIGGKAAFISLMGATLVSLLLGALLKHFGPALPHVLFTLIAGGVSGGLFVLFVGLGVSRCFCPACASPMPKIRLPKTKEEMLWGGWTCSKCGTSLDRFGRPRLR